MEAKRLGWKARVVGEMRKVFLATLFFLVGFTLLAVLLALLAPGERPSWAETGEMMLAATLLALVVGKVVVLAERPIDRMVRRGVSFLGAVAKRAGLFTLAVLLALAVEAVLHGMIAESLSLSEAFSHALHESTAARFCARALYLTVLFSLYSLIFELDAYFAPRRISDVVTSHYVKPRISEAVTMRLGLLESIAAADVEARLQLTQALYTALAQQAEAQQAEFDLFGGSRGVLLWEPADTFSVAKAEAAYESLVEQLRAQEAWWTAQTQIPLRLKAVVTRGQLYTLEVGAGHRRQIVRSGPGLEQAEQRFRMLDEAKLWIDPGLGSDAGGGADSESVHARRPATA